MANWEAEVQSVVISGGKGVSGFNNYGRLPQLEPYIQQNCYSGQRIY